MYLETTDGPNSVKYHIDPYCIEAVVGVQRKLPSGSWTRTVKLFMNGGEEFTFHDYGEDLTPIQSSDIPARLYELRPEFDWVHHMTDRDEEYIVGCITSTVSAVLERKTFGVLDLKVYFNGSGCWYTVFPDDDWGRQQRDQLRDKIAQKLCTASLNEM